MGAYSYVRNSMFGLSQPKLKICSVTIENGKLISHSSKKTFGNRPGKSTVTKSVFILRSHVHASVELRLIWILAKYGKRENRDIFC